MDGSEFVPFKHKALLLINWILPFVWKRLSPHCIIKYSHQASTQSKSQVRSLNAWGGSKSHECPWIHRARMPGVVWQCELPREMTPSLPLPTWNGWVLPSNSPFRVEREPSLSHTRPFLVCTYVRGMIACRLAIIGVAHGSDSPLDLPPPSGTC